MRRPGRRCEPASGRAVSSAWELARELGVGGTTVERWKARADVADPASTPHTLATGVCAEQQAETAVELRPGRALARRHGGAHAALGAPGRLPPGPAPPPRAPGGAAGTGRPRPAVQSAAPEPFGPAHADLKPPARPGPPAGPTRRRLRGQRADHPPRACGDRRRAQRRRRRRLPGALPAALRPSRPHPSAHRHRLRVHRPRRRRALAKARARRGRPIASTRSARPLGGAPQTHPAPTPRPTAWPSASTAATTEPP